MAIHTKLYARTAVLSETQGHFEALTELPGIPAIVACCAAQLHRTLPVMNQMTEAASHAHAHAAMGKLVYNHGYDESLMKTCFKTASFCTNVCARTSSWVWIRWTHGNYKCLGMDNCRFSKRQSMAVHLASKTHQLESCVKYTVVTSTAFCL